MVQWLVARAVGQIPTSFPQPGRKITPEIRDTNKARSPDTYSITQGIRLVSHRVGQPCHTFRNEILLKRNQTGGCFSNCRLDPKAPKWHGGVLKMGFGRYREAKDESNHLGGRWIC